MVKHLANTAHTKRMKSPMHRYSFIYFVLLIFADANNVAAEVVAGKAVAAQLVPENIAPEKMVPENIVELRGTPEQGGLVYGRVAAGAQVWLDAAAVRVTPSGDFVIGFDRDAKPAAQLAIVDRTGRRHLQTLAVKQRQYAIQRVAGVPPRTVEPPPEELERIAKEQKLVATARAIDSDRREFLGPFQWPLLGPISGVYGSQRFYNGEPRRPHFGVDVAASVGAPVRAPAAATVTLAEPDLFFSGGTLIMDHGYGVSSTFMHLSRLLVKNGDRVEAGQVVAEVGATGRASGPHLDWRINWFDVRIDPQLVAPPMPNRFGAAQP